MKSKKRVIIPIIIVLVVVAAAVYAVSRATGGPQARLVDTYTAELTDLASSVAVTGVVESASETNVYTTLTYPVKTVEVEVGDRVAAGDILCVLDTATLESTIAQSEATLTASEAKIGHSIQMAEEGSVNDPENTRINYDVQIETARATIETAENNVDAQRSRVSDLRKQIRDVRDERLMIPEGATYDDYLEDLKSQLVQAEILLENNELTHESALTNLNTLMDEKDRILPQAEQAARDSLETAQLGAADLESQRIALEKLRGDLAKGSVAAEVSGTVTAVYAKEGAVASGVLFVIEDTDALLVSTNIKEYDIGTVGEGMPVTIKTDGTGDEEFTGTLTKIYPTAAKDPTGAVIDTTSVEFPAEISVDPGSKLRIGMNARLSIVTEAKTGVLTVPIDAISEDADGSTYLFVVAPGADGTSTAKRLPVTTGLETDLYSEITGSELKEGDLVITNAGDLTDGAPVFASGAPAGEASESGEGQAVGAVFG